MEMLRKTLKIFLKICSLFAIVLLTYGGLWLATPTSWPLPEVGSIRLHDDVRFGKWLLTGAEVPANWLGQKYQGKTMREPINIIIMDEVATSQEDAVKYLLDSCARIGYPSRRSHSSDYRGQIGKTIYPQLPRDLNHAFSNALFILPNNHGRIFGPHFHDGKYYFSGAFSREGINMLAEVRHVYVSFELAKQDFAARLHASGRYSIAGVSDMGNILPDNGPLTTGDHNGTAVLLRRGK